MKKSWKASSCWPRPRASSQKQPVGSRSAYSRKLVKQGLIKKNEVTVAYITGNGLKTQEAVIDAVGRPTRIQPGLVAFEKNFKLGKNGGES